MAAADAGLAPNRWRPLRRAAWFDGWFVGRLCGPAAPGLPTPRDPAVADHVVLTSVSTTTHQRLRALAVMYPGQSNAAEMAGRIIDDWAATAGEALLRAYARGG